MAHDWGHLFRQGVGALFGGGGATGSYMPPMSYFPSTPTQAPDVPAAMPTAAAGIACATECDGMIWQGAAPPKGYKVVNSCGVGVLRKVRRRRRRRLLTQSDKADISYIVATTGKGQLAASLIHKSTH